MAGRRSPAMFIFIFLSLLLSSTDASHVGAIVGDAAVSQVLRHVAAKILEHPRSAEINLLTRKDPGLGSLASLDLLNQLHYRNISLKFHKQAVDVKIDDFSLASNANLSNLLWPLGLGDQLIDVDLNLSRVEVGVQFQGDRIQLRSCLLDKPQVSASVRDHWLADKGASVLAALAQPMLHSTVCSALGEYLHTIHHNNIIRLPLYDLMPAKIKKVLHSQQTTFYYKMKSVQIADGQLTALAQIEWDELIYDPIDPLLSSAPANSSSFDLELRGDDRVTVWLEDGILNEVIDQVDWTFEWMQERIPLDSPVIPPDSRDFLSTLCTKCYFLLNVTAQGKPTIAATNDSFVLEKRDRVHLRVVNPDRNVTSVFVSFVLTINAEARPSFDNGTLRTLVQLLDTHIEMENGAFPKNWALFMQDLMRGMILDMMWPEIKAAIEDISYGKGVQVPRACGIDPKNIDIDIGEGVFAFTSRLALGGLDVDKCIDGLKAAIPNTSKLFQKAHKRR